ncbi:hypothetical protein [Nostoc sp. LEGE 12450]|nr:hypothetical protein [Nostoc sp. LEGE 12450]MBE8991589.1 hypothetical protein [Nostoc sp. LEGE 12450]
MVTKFDHNLVMAGIPSSKVTLRRSPRYVKETEGTFQLGIRPRMNLSH